MSPTAALLPADSLATGSVTRLATPDPAALLQAFGTPLLALRARTDARGVVLDWQVQSANPALGQLLGVDAARLVGHAVSTVLPAWAGLDLMPDCVATLRFGQPRALSRLLTHGDGVARQIAVQINPCPGGVVLSMTDLSRWLPASRSAPLTAGLEALNRIADRRAFDERIRAAVLCARRSADALSLVLIEVQPEVNGQAASAERLRDLASLLEAVCERDQDLVAQFGSSRFALLLPAADAAGVTQVVARLVQALERAVASSRAFPALCLGVASLHRDGNEASLRQRADAALERARQSAAMLGAGTALVSVMVDGEAMAVDVTLSGSVRRGAGNARLDTGATASPSGHVGGQARDDFEGLGAVWQVTDLGEADTAWDALFDPAGSRARQAAA